MSTLQTPISDFQTPSVNLPSIDLTQVEVQPETPQEGLPNPNPPAAPSSTSPRVPPSTSGLGDRAFASQAVRSRVHGDMDAVLLARRGGRGGGGRAGLEQLGRDLRNFSGDLTQGIQNWFRGMLNGGFATARDLFEGPVEVSEAIERASELPANPNRDAHNNRRPDGAGDALKHVTHSALTQYLEPRVSGALLQTKEYAQGVGWLSPDNNAEASAMDRHNNRVGFRIGNAARREKAAGRLTDADAPGWIMERVIEEMNAADAADAANGGGLAGWDGDRNGNGPYWRSYGFETLDQAAPGWADRARDTMRRQSGRALDHNLPTLPSR